MLTILILTQNYKNESVVMLAEALKTEQKPYLKYEVVIWEINKFRTVKIKNDYLKMEYKTDNIKFRLQNDRILLSDIVFVIKRTWGSIQDKVLYICRQLERENISVLNGSNFIAWCHSKIDQYRDLGNQGVIPKNIFFDGKFITEMNEENFELKYNHIIKMIENYIAFPLIVKLSKGCAGKDVYLIESEKALKQLLSGNIGLVHSG